ncbi:uroporphyrinogen-III C-methyltransferase [Georgenia phoenicis]|uniref:uroporphyrinogen-III C-methyltransferase n=1 Tax=unclassified Georgenia TaxID=2626815 RepID=UPI0039B02009
MTTLLGIELAGRTVLVAGGGPVAARRVRAMLEDGALVRLVAPRVCAELAQLLLDDGVTWLAREVAETDLDDAWLVLAASDDAAVNEALAGWAASRRTWCVTATPGGTARTAATTRTGDVIVGVVTDSRSPAGDAPGADPRRVVHDTVAELLRGGGIDGRRRRHPGPGSVVLVGGGPGAVDLLTVRGRRALAEADVVVVDRLGPVEVLDELAPDVEVVYVGKTPGHHPVPQEEINAILVAQARRGRRVVRLKGGDSFVFGRGGEEVAACQAAGIPVEVVPGVSSALSVPALAGIPLTHRGTATAFHVVSGHDGLDEGALVSVRDRATTLVILMGVAQLPRLTAQLQGAGADPDLPVAVVENGSTPRQRVTRTVLRDLARRAAEVGVRSPAVIVVGEVAAEQRLSREAEQRLSRELIA